MLEFSALLNITNHVADEHLTRFAGKNQKVRTCLQIKSCVGHNLLKTIIALAVVLRVFGNLSPKMK